MQATALFFHLVMYDDKKKQAYKCVYRLTEGVGG